MFDKAVIKSEKSCGTDDDLSLLVDFDKCVHIIKDTYNMSYEDAREFFEFNIVGGTYGGFGSATICFVNESVDE